jgi:hypothetical protein
MKLIYSLLFCLAVLLSACAPKYELVKTRIPPKQSSEVQSCLNKLNSNFLKCSKNRAIRESICFAKGKEEAERKFLILSEAKVDTTNGYYERKKLYNIEKQRYEKNYSTTLQLAEYHKQKCRSALFGRAQHCSKAKVFAYKLLSLEAPIKPSKPKVISLSELIETEQSKCRNLSDCDGQFDTGFVVCGGRIETKKICVKNCG